jgi:tetratricopeptide (TPR) repeat protein
MALELKSQLEALVARSVPEQRARATPVSPVDVELLKSLGYLGISTPLSQSVRQQELPDPKDKLAAFKCIAASAQLAAEGKCAQALAPLARLAQEEPSLFLAHLLLGQCRLSAGQYEAAADAFAAAIRLRPDAAEAFFYKGVCDFHLGRMDDSLDALNFALKIKPEYSHAHFYLGRIYQKRQQMEEALAEFQKCIATDPDFEDAHYKLGYILAELGKYSEAIRHFQKVVSLNARDAEAHYNLGLAYAKLGDAEAARPEFDTACRLNPALCKGSRR